MIEKDLGDILFYANYLSGQFTREFYDVTFPNDLSLDRCWDCFSEMLISNSRLTEFWSSCGYSQDSMKKTLLSQLRPAVLTSVFYYALKYLYNAKNMGAVENVDLSFYRSFLNATDYYGTEYGGEKTLYEQYNIRAKKSVGQLKKLFEQLHPVDPYLNSVAVFTQNSAYQSLDLVIFPEIIEYLIKSVGITGNSHSEKERMGPNKLVTSSLLKVVTILLIDNTEMIPGHRYNSTGKYTLNMMKSFDDHFISLMTSGTIDPCNALSYDLYEGNASLPLTFFGIEDLFHLNRISFAIKRFLDYSFLHEDLSQKQLRLAAHFFSTLVYAPTTGIQEMMVKDIELCLESLIDKDDGNKEITEETLLAFRRVLSISAVLFPSIVSSFTFCLFSNDGTLPVERVLERLNGIPDAFFQEIEDTFGWSEKVWNMPEYHSFLGFCDP